MEDRDKIIDYTKSIRLPDDYTKVRKNFTQGYFYREIGRYKNAVPSEFQWAAEDKLINKTTFEELKCQLPDSPRSTFLMVFSPDGKKVASTHGNHNVYVTDLTTGKNIQTLSGHPRTPWCIAFHPSSNQILASGCLGGQVRVWDLHGGSEVWTAESQTVIASLAFHPVHRMLVIATYNELHFWDWSQPEPFAKCSTKSEREKVRYVSFDHLGNKLITGIANPVSIPSQWDRINLVNSQQPPSTSTTVAQSFTSTPTATVSSTQSSSESGRSITFCYRHLMNQYNQLVNRYFDLSRSRITPTIDRGTDPMDLLDLRSSGNNSESTTSNPSSSTSNSPSNSSSPLRFKFTRTASRPYRSLGSRERFRIHSSVFNRISNRSILSNSVNFSTISSISTPPNSSLTTSPSTGSQFSSQSSPRLHRCAFSLGPTSRSWCLSLNPETSSNLFFSRNTSQSGSSSSRAITNPTYTSYSDRGILSTRETGSNNSERSQSQSQFSVVWPYRVLFDDDDNHHLIVHRTSQSDSGEPSGNRTDPNVLGNETAERPFRYSTHLPSLRSSQDRIRRFSDDTDRETRTSSSAFHLRSERNDLISLSSLAEEPDSGREFRRNNRSLFRQQSTPMDLRNISPESRFRENSFERRISSRNSAQPSPQSLMHPKPVPRFQVRSRLQDQQSQLHLITNRETHGLNLQNNQSLRRQLSFRPGGQFVLSRHSNSPFQPRVPHHLNNSFQKNSPITPKDNRTVAPEIPSVGSSFATSLPSSLNASENVSRTSSSGGGTTSSPNTVSSSVAFSGQGCSRQTHEQIKTRLFDRVEMMLRDRMRNSIYLPSVDSTVNYSRISGEPEEDVQSPLHSPLESDEIPLSRGMGPRGTDPMLSSASDNRDSLNETAFFRESPTSSTSLNSNGFNETNNSAEMLDMWESEIETVPFSLSSALPLNDTLSEGSRYQESEQRSHTQSRESENGSSSISSCSSSSRSEGGSSLSSAEFNMRQGIQRLSHHIENLQRLCWARIEILQRQKIRGVWDNLTTQIRRFQNSHQNENNESTRNQTEQIESNDLPSIRDLAISGSPNYSETNSCPNFDSNYNGVINWYKELVEFIVTELFNEAKKAKTTGETYSQKVDHSRKKNSNTIFLGSAAAGNCRNETEDPQPGPSGLSSSNISEDVRNSLLTNENLKFRLCKLFLEALQKERRRELRLAGAGTSSGLSRQNNYLRLRNSSRTRFRNNRHNRHVLGFFALRSRTLNKFLNNSATGNSQAASSNTTDRNSTLHQPSTSKSKNFISNDACQSCGQKKKSTREPIRQKRRNTDSSSNVDVRPSSKVLKNNVGERRRVSIEEKATPSTSNDARSTAAPRDTSTNELLRQMIQTMETMLQFLRGAFCKTGEQTSSSSQPSTSLTSSGDDSDSDSNDQNEQSVRNLPRNISLAKEIAVDLMRDGTRVHAKKVLGYMVKGLTQLFEKNFGDLIQVLDEQIFSLYMLLHLALELTELLLDQLNSRSRDLERTWTAENANGNSFEEESGNSLLFRARGTTGRFRERNRNLGRSSYNTTLRTNQEDDNRFSTRSSSDGSGSFLSNYVRKRRRIARMSTSLPSGWWSRSNRSILRFNSSPAISRGIPNRRPFRFDRLSRGDLSSRTRAFEYEMNNVNRRSSNNANDDNNNNNHDYGFNEDRNNNNNNSSNNNNNINNNNNNSCNNNNNNNNVIIINNSNNMNSSSSNSNNSSNVNRNRNNESIGDNNNNRNNTNFFNHYFSRSSDTNSESNNNNIILLTGVSSSNDEVNNSGSNLGSGRNIGEENAARAGGSNSSFISQNPLPLLRAVELNLSRSESGDLSLRDERPIFWIRYGGSSESSGSLNDNESQPRVGSFTVPVVQVNDVPVSDISMLNQPRQRPQSPVPRVPEDIWRWRAWRPRLLHPRYNGPNPFDEQDSNDVPENIHYYRILSTSVGSHLGVYTLDPMIITDAPLSPHHRIQAWDFSKLNIPDISDREANGVVPECKIHNDASVDVSNDGHLLVTLLPSGRLSITTMLGVYSLDWSSLGQLLYRTSFEQNAVSVSLSPTNRHLLVGLASRPVVVRDRTNMAQIFRLEGGRPSPHGGSWQSGRGRLVHMRDLEQTRETNNMSLNCIRWAPGAGQGLVYGTNTGQLKVLR